MSFWKTPKEREREREAKSLMKITDSFVITAIGFFLGNTRLFFNNY